MSLLFLELSLWAFLAWTTSHGRSFKLQAESVSGEQVTFVDLYIFKGVIFKNERRLDCQVTRKPTAIGTPLLPTCEHQPNSHFAWPRGVTVRTRRLCSSNEEAEAAVPENV